MLINQGRYTLSSAKPCGTNGLGPCVGVAIYHGQWFVAHIDCETVVKGKSRQVDPLYGKVADYTTSRLRALLGPCGSPEIFIVSGFSDFSAHAIVEGITSWIGAVVVPTILKQDGFVLKINNTVGNPGHAANDTAGTGVFSIPVLVA